MKKLALALCLLAVSFTAQAQFEKGITIINPSLSGLDFSYIQSPNQKIPDRKTKCVIETHLNIKQNVIFGAK